MAQVAGEFITDEMEQAMRNSMTDRWTIVQKRTKGNRGLSEKGPTMGDVETGLEKVEVKLKEETTMQFQELGEDEQDGGEDRDEEEGQEGQLGIDGNREEERVNGDIEVFEEVVGKGYFDEGEKGEQDGGEDKIMGQDEEVVTIVRVTLTKAQLEEGRKKSVKGEDRNFLVDSGATMSIINNREDFAEMYELVGKVKVEGIGGDTYTTKGGLFKFHAEDGPLSRDLPTTVHVEGDALYVPQAPCNILSPDGARRFYGMREKRMDITSQGFVRLPRSEMMLRRERMGSKRVMRTRENWTPVGEVLTCMAWGEKEGQLVIVGADVLIIVQMTKLDGLVVVKGEFGGKRPQDTGGVGIRGERIAWYGKVEELLGKTDEGRKKGKDKAKPVSAYRARAYIAIPMTQEDALRLALDHNRKAHCSGPQCVKMSRMGLIEGDINYNRSRGVKSLACSLICPGCKVANLRKPTVRRSNHKIQMKAMKETSERPVASPGAYLVMDRLVVNKPDMYGRTTAVILTDLGSGETEVIICETKKKEEVMKKVLPKIIRLAQGGREMRERSEMGMERGGGEKSTVVEMANKLYRSGVSRGDQTHIRMDNEFGYLETKLAEHGIRTQKVAAYSSEMNAAAERINKAVGEMIRVCLYMADLPQELWSDVAEYYFPFQWSVRPFGDRKVRAMVERFIDQSGMTEREADAMLRGPIPAISPFILRRRTRPHRGDCRTFGTPCYVYTEPDKKTDRHKLDPRARQAIYVGTADVGLYRVRYTEGVSPRNLISLGSKYTDEEGKEIPNPFHTVHVVSKLSFDDEFASEPTQSSPMFKMFASGLRSKDMVYADKKYMREVVLDELTGSKMRVVTDENIEENTVDEEVQRVQEALEIYDAMREQDKQKAVRRIADQEKRAINILERKEKKAQDAERRKLKAVRTAERKVEEEERRRQREEGKKERLEREKEKKRQKVKERADAEKQKRREVELKVQAQQLRQLKNSVEMLRVIQREQGRVEKRRESRDKNEEDLRTKYPNLRRSGRRQTKASAMTVRWYLESKLRDGDKQQEINDYEVGATDGVNCLWGRAEGEEIDTEEETIKESIDTTVRQIRTEIHRIDKGVRDLGSEEDNEREMWSKIESVRAELEEMKREIRGDIQRQQESEQEWEKQHQNGRKDLKETVMMMIAQTEGEKEEEGQTEGEFEEGVRRFQRQLKSPVDIEESKKRELEMMKTKYDGLDERAKKSMDYSATEMGPGGDAENWVETMGHAIKADLDKESPVAHPGSVEAEMEDKLKNELVHRAGIDVKVRQGDKKEAISLLGSVELWTGEQWRQFRQENPWARNYSTIAVRTVKLMTIGDAEHDTFTSKHKTRIVVTDVAAKGMKPRFDPTGPRRGEQIVTTAPTSSALTKRMFYAIASALGISILYQIDFTAAFLNAKVDAATYIFAKPHPIFYKEELIGPETEMFRLKGYIYGCREAPAMWYKTLRKSLEELGYTCLGKAYDKGLFFRSIPRQGESGEVEGKDVSMILLHVDDMMTGDTQGGKMVEELLKGLKEKYGENKVSFRRIDGDEEDERGRRGFHIFTGWSVKRNDTGGWSIGQEDYIERQLVKHGVWNRRANRNGRQVPTGDPLSREDEAKDEMEVKELEREFGFKFASMEGAMIHLLQTRLDVDLVVRQLARFSKLPGRRVFEFMNHFCGYLQETRDAYLCFEGPKKRNGRKEMFNARSNIRMIAAATPKTELRYDIRVWDSKREKYHLVERKVEDGRQKSDQELQEEKEVMERIQGKTRKELDEKDKRIRDKLVAMKRASRSIPDVKNQEYNQIASKAKLELISDANHGVNEGGDFRAKYSYMLMFRGTAVQSTSSMMGEIPNGVMANEAHAMAQGSDEGEYLSEFLDKIHIQYFGGSSPLQPGLIPTYVDNESVVKAVMNKDRSVVVRATKPVQLKLEKFSNLVGNGKRLVMHIGTKYNPADHGTKFNSGESVRLHSQIMTNDRFGVFDRALRKKVGEEVKARLDSESTYWRGIVEKVHKNGEYDIRFSECLRNRRGHQTEDRDYKMLRVHRTSIKEG